MKYIYFLFWFSFKNIIKTDGKGTNRHEKAQLSGHIVGGVEVPITMYPHVVALVIERRKLCGGSIISDRLIVTAGHCVVDKKLRQYAPEAFEVFPGSAYQHRGTPYVVCKVVPHEKYTKSIYKQHRYFYDIAVLMLSKRIEFGPKIQKIAIAPNKSWRKEKYHFTVTGFGAIETKGIVSQKLLATRMQYVNSRTCNQSQASSPMIIPKYMFCMIGQRWTSDCFGDSGSGVIWRRYLVGLVSTGRDAFCGADVIPSMYTDVTYFRKWIHSKMKEAATLHIRNCHSHINQRKRFKSKKSR